MVHLWQEMGGRDAEAERGPQPYHTLAVPRKLPKGRIQPFPTKPIHFVEGATYILISFTYFQGYSELEQKQIFLVIKSMIT